MKIGIYMLIGLLSSVLFADEGLKEWISINCYGIEQINCTYMWGCESNTNQYILSNDDLYQFKVSGNQAVLELYMAETEVYPEERPYFGDKTILYDAFYNTLYKINLDLTNYSKTEYYEHDMNLNNGQCFLMNNNHYYIDYNNTVLYRLELNNASPCQLDYTPSKIFTSIVLHDTLYYVSASGVGAFKISENDRFEHEQISKVSELIGNNENIVLVTDKQERIWIIDSIAGVIEYDTKTKTKEAKTIAKFPNIQSQDYDYDKVCFYINGYLYYIANNQVYSLEVTPHKTGKDWSNPSIPIENNAREPQYFYDYNLADNTLTYSESNINTFPKDMEKIHCYSTMPKDTIQAVFANNRFYILTKRGKNHIARLAGSNLKYITSWNLTKWTPRIGASVVEMNNAIYVFGGKKIDSNTCYNDLYIYDCDKKSSKKLKVNAEVTARYNATILASEDYNQLCIIGGKNASDSKALDAWVFNPNGQKWEYINDIPPHTGKVSTRYDEENNTLKVCITFEEKEQERVIFDIEKRKERNISYNPDSDTIEINNTDNTQLLASYQNMSNDITNVTLADNPSKCILTENNIDRVFLSYPPVHYWEVDTQLNSDDTSDDSIDVFPICAMKNKICILSRTADSKRTCYIKLSIYDVTTEEVQEYTEENFSQDVSNFANPKIFTSKCYNKIWIVENNSIFEFDADNEEWININESNASARYENGNIILTVTPEPRSAIEYQIEKLFSITPPPPPIDNSNRKNVINNTTNNYIVISGSSKAYENPIDPIKDEEDIVSPDDKQENDNPSHSIPDRQKTKPERTSKTPKIPKASSGAVVYKSCFWVSTEVFIALAVLYIVRRCRKH